jgi:hypothetical protein
MYNTMKLQDFFPYDSTVLGLRNLYSEVGNDSFFVNSNCVVAQRKIMTRKKHYIIFDKSVKSRIKMTEVILVDLFIYQSYVHLIVQDINTRRISRVSFCLECPETDCTRLLVDINYFIDRMDEKAIRDYCGCCGNHSHPISKSSPKSTDDLLDFEF